MTGLEKIVSKITAEGQAQGDEIISEAVNKANEIIDEAKKAANEKSKKILAEAEKESQRRISVARSSADSITRTRYLQVRNAVVNDIISAAYERIEVLDDKDYFDLLYKICVKNIENGECVMKLSKKDIARLPADFEDRINKAVYEKGAVQISKEPIDIENGFVLVYGDMEVNCTFRAVFDEKMDSLKDLLNPVLFG